MQNILRTFWEGLHDQVVACDQALRGFLKGKREKEEERKESGFESGEGDRWNFRRLHNGNYS